MEKVLLELIALVKELTMANTILAKAAIENRPAQLPIAPLPTPSQVKLYSTEKEEDIQHLLATGELSKEEAEAELKALEFFSSDISGPITS